MEQGKNHAATALPFFKTLPPKDLNGFLHRFQAALSIDEYNEITVERDCIWRDAIKHYKRKVNDVESLKKSPEVSFKNDNEDGLDGGDTKTEFFELILAEVTKRLFEGDPMNLLPIKDVHVLIVRVILQDGPAYCIPPLAPSVAESILGKSLDDISRFLSKHQIPLNASTESLHEFIERLDLAKTPENLNTTIRRCQQGCVLATSK